MDYTAFVTMANRFFSRADLEGDIDTLLLLAQARICKELDSTELDVATILDVVAGEPIVDLPADFLELKSIRIPYSGGEKNLHQKTMTQSGNVLHYMGGATRSPRWYARYGLKLELTPIPQEDTTLNIVYKALLPPLSEVDNPTDVILNTNPRLYLYAVMFEAALLTQHEEKIAYWDGLTARELESANMQAWKSEWSGPSGQITQEGYFTP
jgi:hypothetical protein